MDSYCDDTCPTQDADWGTVGSESATPVGWGSLLSSTQQHIDLLEPVCVIGRDKKKCLVLLTHQSISSSHCQIKFYRELNVVTVKDTSTNGTELNGVRLLKNVETQVWPGSVISILPGVSYTLQFALNDIPLTNMRECFAEPTGPSNEYFLMQKLGSGAFAEVYRCALRSNPAQHFAVKAMDTAKFKKMTPGKTTQDMLIEIRIMEKLDHPGVLKIHGDYVTSNCVFLVLDLVEGGDLFDDIMRTNGSYGEEAARVLFMQLIDAVDYCHSQDVVHRDIKPENVLIYSFQPVRLKLSDFGLSRKLGNGSVMKTMCGTPQYQAPEIVEGKPYDKSVDLWSLGCLLFILLSGVPPFDSAKCLQQAKKMAYKFDPRYWSGISALAIDLVRQCLQAAPAKRITVAQVRTHPWILNGRLPVTNPSHHPSVLTPIVASGSPMSLVPMSVDTPVNPPEPAGNTKPVGGGGGDVAYKSPNGNGTNKGAKSTPGTKNFTAMAAKAKRKEFPVNLDAIPSSSSKRKMEHGDPVPVYHPPFPAASSSSELYNPSASHIGLSKTRSGIRMAGATKLEQPAAAAPVSNTTMKPGGRKKVAAAMSIDYSLQANATNNNNTLNSHMSVDSQSLDCSEPDLDLFDDDEPLPVANTTRRRANTTGGGKSGGKRPPVKSGRMKL